MRTCVKCGVKIDPNESSCPNCRKRTWGGFIICSVASISFLVGAITLMELPGMQIFFIVATIVFAFIGLNMYAHSRREIAAKSFTYTEETTKSIPTTNQTSDSTQIATDQSAFNSSYIPTVSTDRGDIGPLGALYWFNIDEMSKSGHGLYGRYAYHQLLPLIVATPETKITGVYHIFDGDCLPSEGMEIPHRSHPEERSTLQRAITEGVGNFYIIGIYRESGNMNFDDLHEKIVELSVVGYAGRTTIIPEFSYDVFRLQIISKMNLVYALTINQNMVIKNSFEFMKDEELRKIGFSIIQ